MGGRGRGGVKHSRQLQRAGPTQRYSPVERAEDPSSTEKKWGEVHFRYFSFSVSSSSAAAQLPSRGRHSRQVPRSATIRVSKCY